MEFKIIDAESEHIAKVGELFDMYRQFYQYESNLIRRICGLLYVSDKDSGDIKLKIKKELVK